MQKGIVFDLDETLIDRRSSLDRYARNLRSSFEPNTQLNEEDFVRTFHALDGNGRVARELFFDELSRIAFSEVSPAAIAAHFNSIAWRKPILFPGVLDVVATFKSAGYTIGVATNGGSRSQNAKILNSGLLPHLDAFVISEELGIRKPDPAIYEEIAHRLQISPQASWFVGDDPISDIVGPAGLGFSTAWIERYVPWPEEQPVCYKRRVTHMGELPDALLGNAW